jgi:hypothetical protein
MDHRRHAIMLAGQLAPDAADSLRVIEAMKDLIEPFLLQPDAMTDCSQMP